MTANLSEPTRPAAIGPARCFPACREVRRRGCEVGGAAPPVIVVFAPLAVQEEPAVVDLAARPHDRHASAFRDASEAFLIVPKSGPRLDGQLRKANAHNAGGRAVVRSGGDLNDQFISKLRCAGVAAAWMQVERIHGFDAVAIDGQRHSPPEEVPEATPERDQKPPGQRRYAAVVQAVAARPGNRGAARVAIDKARPGHGRRLGNRRERTARDLIDVEVRSHP